MDDLRTGAKLMQRGNRDTDAARAFHKATKYLAVRGRGWQRAVHDGTPPAVEIPIWQEDWSLEPFPFKVYETLPALPIPARVPTLTALPALEAIARTGAEPQGHALPDRAALARIGLLANGLLNRQRTSRACATIEFRTAGGTGARYHLEIYFVCADLPDLDAGIYHYDAQSHSLRQLRAGDFGALVEATGSEPAVTSAPVVLALTSTFWRNAWRYKARAYRHTFWDAGTTLANALALAASTELPTRLVLGYADAPVNDLLGIDGEREALGALCARPDEPHRFRPWPRRSTTRRARSRRARSPSRRSRDARRVDAGLGAEAAAWRAAPYGAPHPCRRARSSAPPAAPGPAAPTPIEGDHPKRRSTRHYDTDTPIPFEALRPCWTARRAASRRTAWPPSPAAARRLSDRQQRRRISPGRLPAPPAARRDRVAEGGELPAAGPAPGGRAGLRGRRPRQHLLPDRPRAGAGPYGNRGYRLAQLECSLAAGKLHLGTHALGLGAVGSTSFDDEVIDFFSPHAAGKSYMFIHGLRQATAAN